MDYAEEIKSRLTTLEVFTYYGFEPNSRGFVCCPLHGEKTPSLKVFNDDRGWICFGCHKGGDIINFVREYFGLTFADALAKINEDFFLGLPIGEKRTERQRLADAKAAYHRKKNLEKERLERKKIEDEYWLAFKKWKRFDDNKRNYAPKNQTDRLHPLFVEALQNIELSAHQLDVAEYRRQSYGSNYNENTRVFGK